MYVKTRTFWLVNGETDAHKLFFGEAKPSHINIIEKNMQYRWKLLKPPYKYTKTTILQAPHKKTAIAIATNMKKNIFCSIVGGCYKELKVKEFCVFDYIELL